MMRKIRCAIAGLGRIGSTLEKDPLREKPASHAGAITHNPHTCLVAGADTNPDCCDAFMQDWPGVTVYTNTEEMLLREQPQILHIASWTDTHLDLLALGIQYQVPVIVCEKPLANSRREARKILKIAAKGNSKIIMNHERRFSADYQQVKQLIDTGKYGALLSINAKLYMGRTRTPRDVLYHDGTHMIDIIRYLTGTDILIKTTVGQARSRNGFLEIVGTVGTIPLLWEVSSGRDHLVFELDLSFVSGQIRIGNGVYERWESQISPFYTGFRSLKRSPEKWDGQTGYFSRMMEHAVSISRNTHLKSESNLYDGYAVLTTIASILRKCRLFR